MKKIISIVAIFALLASFADLAMAYSKKKQRLSSQRGGVVSDTVRTGDDAVRGTGRVAGNVLQDTGHVVGDIFR